MARVLYLTYDGLLEPLGQSQVWQYLRRLTREHKIVLISFEKPEDFKDHSRMRAMQQQCAAVRLKWIPLRYHKNPAGIAKVFDIAIGLLWGLFLMVRHSIQIIHARSYVPSVIALTLKRLTGARFIFDMRGFWADERVDGGLWPPNGRLYRIAKGFERRFLLGADAVVSLTHAAVELMRKFNYLRDRSIRFVVIPTCADLSLFSPGGPNIPIDPFTLGYVGSVGVWYLFDEVVASFKALRTFRRDARFLVVNRGGHEQVRNAVLKAGLPMHVVDLVSAKHDEVPALLRRMHAGVFYYKPAFSRAATAPTRLAELLGVGIPILTNSGVGDMARIILNGGQPVGVVIEEFSGNSLERAVRELTELARQSEVRSRCRTVSEHHFSVEWGTECYSTLYNQLARHPPHMHSTGERTP